MIRRKEGTNQPTYLKQLQTPIIDIEKQSPGYLKLKRERMNLIEKRHPGYLKDMVDFSDWNPPKIEPRKEIIEKQNCVPDTGCFVGQPGVLYKFGARRGYK